MNQNKYIIIILAVLVFVLVGIIGYLALIKKPTEPTITNYAPSPEKKGEQTYPSEQTSIEVNWEDLIPIIRSVLKSTTFIDPDFLEAEDIIIEEYGPISIIEEKDITGDGISEALISLGTGGVSTDFATLMRLENGKPVVAQFKQENGRIFPIIFFNGGSTMNISYVEMLPDKKAIYQGHWGRDKSEGVCNANVDAYQWNPWTKTFDFNLLLANEIKPEFCRKMEQLAP